jgi:hemerythrin superfamily protein
MYKACEANKRPSGMSIRQFLALGDQFCSSLTIHHGVEERYIFPVLAERMPRFRDQEHLKKQHEGIHEGLDVFEKYLKDCRRGVTELRLDEMKRILDTFGEVLWAHLE